MDVALILANFLSLVFKQEDLASIVNDTNAKMVIGTETWLTPEVLNE